MKNTRKEYVWKGFRDAKGPLKKQTKTRSGQQRK